MRTRAILSAVALAGALIALAANPASAAETAYLEKTQYLTSNPTDGMATSCTSRRIGLAAGNYTWGNYYPGSVRDQYLGTTTYTWTTCLDPKNGYYQQTTTLDPDQSGWDTATISDNLIISPSGTWTWGSYIDPHF
ncbi:hypothetical protein GCM10027280_40910 [Micromonospora polyrhachis]|uniref:Uncharacterized protein n=1 Tax=Micromonospora polyrhachis TaxID=1282883 RepID=A0A7W7SNF3_9ACTN|nr:hypothetical protein [Micromonospora polyrhachis]MBB4956790.1 hypothetical protein [Micromonospora polyrhachis]